jgi:hypothetical protein
MDVRVTAFAKRICRWEQGHYFDKDGFDRNEICQGSWSEVGVSVRVALHMVFITL